MIFSVGLAQLLSTKKEIESSNVLHRVIMQN